MKMEITICKSVKLAAAASLLITGIAAATPDCGHAGITTADVIAAQRQFLKVPPLLSGCKLEAADVAMPFGTLNAVDVIAIQRYILGLPGFGLTGTTLPAALNCALCAPEDVYGNTN